MPPVHNATLFLRFRFVTKGAVVFHVFYVVYCECPRNINLSSMIRIYAHTS